jgi:hypothetical protein
MTFVCKNCKPIKKLFHIISHTKLWDAKFNVKFAKFLKYHQMHFAHQMDNKCDFGYNMCENN